MSVHIAAANALSPPTAGKGPRPAGIIKSTPEHFQVVELPAVAPSGSGAHRWLELERVDMNTEYAARRVARDAGVQPREVGFAGLKDRHARTRQWFSVPGHDDDRALVEALTRSGLQVLSSERHDRKLRRGALSGNRFRILVLTAATPAAAQGDYAALTQLAHANARRVREYGAPNYFGAQRFGHHGNNLQQAQRMLCEGVAVRERHRRGLYLSAARSALFNQVLAARVDDCSWDSLLDGEAVALEGSASFFLADAQDPTLAARLQAFDVHPSGPLVGEGESPATGVAAQVERDALKGCEALVAGLCAQRMASARRALRVRVADLQLTPEADEGWWLEFSLPAGAYATVVLRELFDIVDASRRAAHQGVALESKPG